MAASRLARSTLARIVSQAAAFERLPTECWTAKRICHLSYQPQTLGSSWARGQVESHRNFHLNALAFASLQVKIPALGESITDGAVAAILKQPGDPVEEDEPIVQIETDKVTVDVRAPTAGTIETILVSVLVRCRRSECTATKFSSGLFLLPK